MARLMMDTRRFLLVIVIFSPSAKGKFSKQTTVNTHEHSRRKKTAEWRTIVIETFADAVNFPMTV